MNPTVPSSDLESFGSFGLEILVSNPAWVHYLEQSIFAEPAGTNTRGTWWRFV